MRERMNFRSVGLAIMLLMLVGLAQGADIYQLYTMPSGGNPNWATSAGLAIGYWVPNTPNTAGNVYWVGTMPDGLNKPPGSVYNGGRMQFRTPNNSTSVATNTFNGDMLILSTSATLMLKMTNGYAATIPQIRAQGWAAPRIECGNNGVLELAGTLLDNQVIPASYMNFAVTDTSGQRHIKITTKITGPGHIQCEGGKSPMDFANHAVIFDNNTNDFTGRVVTYRNVKIIVNQPNGLGNTTTVTLANTGQLFNNTVLNMPNCKLQVSNSAKLTVLNNMTWKSLHFTSTNTQLAPGTYPAATLATTYPGVIADGSGGTANVTIVSGLSDIDVTQGGNPLTTITFVNHNAVWGPPLTQTITITNNGFQPLTFNPNYNTAGYPGIELVTGSNPMYSVVSAVPSTATPLAPNASLVLTLRMSGTASDYDPLGTNLSTGTLRIRTDAVSSANKSFPIRGNTVPVEMSTFSAR